MTQDLGKVFIEKILTEAGLSDLPEEYKEQYIPKLEEQINRRIGIIIIDNLKGEDSEKFADMINVSPAPSASQLQEFFSDKIPDLEEKIRIGLSEFAAEFISNAKK